MNLFPTRCLERRGIAISSLDFPRKRKYMVEEGQTSSLTQILDLRRFRRYPSRDIFHSLLVKAIRSLPVVPLIAIRKNSNKSIERFGNLE